MSMPTLLRRVASTLALVLAAHSTPGCGSAPRVEVQTGPASADTSPDRAEVDARAAIEALHEIPDTRVCITPELCEDLREWRPERLAVLDGHLVAIGREHAFIRVNGAWAHHAIPLHGEPMSNGHASFFCDHEGGVFELTAEGLRRRGTLPEPGCAAVVAAGSQLYVVVGDGPILRQDGNEWAPLEMELPYGNGYSVNTVVMTPTRAFLVDREARLLELPSAGPSYEPRLAVETGLGHMTTLRAVPGRETIVAIGRELAILEDGSVRRVPLPGRERPATSPEPSTENEDEGSEGGEDEAYAEEEYAEEEGGEDGVRQISDTEFEMGLWVVGLDPVIVTRGHVVMTPETPRGQLTLDHYVLGPSGWSAMSPRSPESFLFAAGAGAFTTTLPDRTSPVHLGPYRIVVNTYRERARGPLVTAWRHDDVDVALTAFPPEEVSAALEARCEGEGVRCEYARGGSIVRLVSGPTPTLEILSADGTEVLLRHEGHELLRVLAVAGRERAYVVTGDRSVGYVDAEGLHPIAQLAGASVREVHVASEGTAYVVGRDGHVSYFDGSTLTPVPQADAFASAMLWYPLAGGVVVPLSRQRPVWLRGAMVHAVELGGARPPEFAVRTRTGEIVLAARDGHSWILRDAEVHEVTAPAPDAAHASAPIYYLPEDALDAPWRVTFAHPFSPGARYRAPAPTTTRPLGPIDGRARPYRAPLVELDPYTLNESDERALARDALHGATPPAVLAFWESRRLDVEVPVTWAGSAMLADPSMDHVVFATQPAFSSETTMAPSVVSQFVAMRETTPEQAPPGSSVAALARRLADAPAMTEARAFRLADGRASRSELLGLVPAGPRAEEILRVRLERGRTAIVEVIDRGNSRATLVGRLSVPARSTLTFGAAAVSEDGQRVALALGLAPDDDEDGARASARHAVLPLPAALSSE